MKVFSVIVNVLPSEDEFNHYEVVVMDAGKRRSYKERIHYQTEQAQGESFFERLVNTAMRLVK